VAVLAAAAFAAIAVVAVHTVPPAFDMRVREAVHGWASPWLTAGMRAITLLGSGWFLFAAGVVAAIREAMRGRRREAAYVGLAIVGAKILEQSAKYTFARVRPEAFFGYPQPDTFSFPSGHALASLCFYVAVTRIWFGRRAVGWIVCGLLVAAIGLSRVYLGVHYPSDVLAGYALGICWMALVSSVLCR
jgi:membrane-associated phospholipid phosphatase